MINYQVKMGDQREVLTPQMLMFQLNSALQGSNKYVESVSPDGRFISINQDGQSLRIPIQTAMEKMGMQVESALPSQENVDYSGIDAGWRYAVNNLENDYQRQAYIQQKLAEEGMGNLEVSGQGRDWFAYDPAQGKYLALTNSPDWDMADLAEGATDALRYGGGIVGGALGGLVGSPTGPGAIAAAAGGGALGTAVGETASRGLASLDPTYREVFDMDTALSSATPDILLGGVAGGAGKALGAGLRTFMPNLGKAPISGAVGSVGRGLGAAGVVAEEAGKAGASKLGSSMATAFTPGLGTAQLAGFAAQVPEFIGKYGGRAIKAMFPAAEETLENAAKSGLGRFSQSLGTVGRGVESGAENVFRAGSRGVQYAGKGIQALGKGLQAKPLQVAEEAVYRAMPQVTRGTMQSRYDKGIAGQYPSSQQPPFPTLPQNPYPAPGQPRVMPAYQYEMPSHLQKGFLESELI